MRFVIVAEDQLGYRLIRDLADRVIAERGPSWLQDLWSDEATRESQRTWSGFEHGTRWSSRGDIVRLASSLSVRVHGRGMKAEAAMARKAVLITAELPTRCVGAPAADALFLVHDTDGDERVRDRLRDGAGRGERRAFAVLIAAPAPESEAWVVAGAAPQTDQEKELHDAERQRLGFDPVRHPDQLTSGRSDDKRDAKKVCRNLRGDHGEYYERWERCWTETPLDTLEHNAERAGLRAYTEEVETQILPLLRSEHAR